MNFILFISQLPSFSKRDIDAGNTPPLVYEVIEACRCAFSLSHAIRADVNFALDILQENLFLLYRGERLRYLGPDERSQALLLGKAVDLGRSLAIGQSKQSTPGIHVWKGGYEANLAGVLGKNGIILRPGAAPLNANEVLALDSFIAGVGCEVPPNLSASGNHIDLVGRAFPPPYDTASLGTQILYLHHVRDTS